MNDSILQAERRLDSRMREDALVGHFMTKMEDWVVQLARQEADRSVVTMKKSAIDDAVAAANESTDERLAEFEKSIHSIEQSQIALQEQQQQHQSQENETSRAMAERMKRSMTTVANKDPLYNEEEFKDRD